MGTRAPKSVGHNFLETYTSRYTDRDGYWLFGFLARDLTVHHFDLFHDSAPATDEAFAVAARLAATKLKEQANHARVNFANIERAVLQLERLPGDVEWTVNGRYCKGWNVRFE